MGSGEPDDRPREGQTWTRDDYLVTLDLYLNEDSVEQIMDDERVQEVAKVIGRTPGAVSSRLGNYRYVDPAESSGMSHISEEARAIWEEYYGNEEELAYEAEQARNRFRLSLGEEDEAEGDEAVEVGETSVKQRSRQGQEEFRKAVRDRYGDECLLCDVDSPGLLQAAHILDWNEYEEHRGQPANGLLLCYTHHRAFDLQMFTVSENYELIVRPDFSVNSTFLKRTITNQSGKTVDLTGSPSSKKYLRKHNEENVTWW
jgi:hypothetical protein